MALLRDMYRRYFLILLGAFSFSVNAFAWDEKNSVVGYPQYSPLHVFNKNPLKIGQMDMGVLIIDGVYFSKWIAPEYVVKKTWGRLKLYALEQLQEFIFKNKINSYKPIQQTLFKIYFKHHAVLNLKGGMVVAKNKIGDKAQLIYGVPLTGVKSINPSIEDVHKTLKKLLFTDSLHAPCDYFPFSDNESRAFISAQYAC